MATIKILAGKTAYEHIQQNGLNPADIGAVFGASGAAKWLTIHGLDSVIFDQWLSQSNQPIDLFGTSVGAFKLAAAAQKSPKHAMALLADAYIQQRYEGEVTAERIAFETNRILTNFLGEQAIVDILANPRYNYHCGSVRAMGVLASHNITVQKLAMGKAFTLSLLGRNSLRNTLERVVFSAGQSVNELVGNDCYTTHNVVLTAENFLPAITSSGSIPVIMPSVDNIAGAPAGVYRDGGLLDYHPVPSNIGEINNGLVLYPHFYTQVKEGWFDKFAPWRTVSGKQLDNTVVIGPSDDYVTSLPGGSIPDRRDFITFKDDTEERIRRWTIASDRSHELGHAFMDLAVSGDIAAEVELIP